MAGKLKLPLIRRNILARYVLPDGYKSPFSTKPQPTPEKPASSPRKAKAKPKPPKTKPKPGSKSK